jgi:hypothetical protein
MKKNTEAGMTTLTKERFEVSTEGMRELHAGRPAWQLIKELVANAWDEDTTRCDVNVTIEGRTMTVDVTDDGPGFADIKDAWTLMAHTEKRGRPDVRGRFNVGEKEILSVAREGYIETKGFTVIFPRSGGREVRETTKESGTRIHAVLTRNGAQIGPLENMLRMFLVPKGIDYVVNGVQQPHRAALRVTEATLPTVLQSGPAEPLRDTTRKTEVRILPTTGEKGWLYEMGIPVQELECPYHVDVMQKIPLPPNRDAVRASYMQDIYSVVLEAMIDDIGDDQAAATWVQRGVEDERTSDDTVKRVLAVKLGDSVLWSSDLQANERATEAGLHVVHPKLLSKKEKERFMDQGLATASKLYGSKPTEDTEVEPTVDMTVVGIYAQGLADDLLDIDLTVRFYENSDSRVAASYMQHGAKAGRMSFNVANLGESWFDGNHAERHTSLIIHELAHHGESFTPHTGDYVDRLADLGAKLAHMWKREER